MKEAVIVAGARTPVGKAKKGAFKSMRSDELAGIAIQETLKRSGYTERSMKSSSDVPYRKQSRG